MVNLIIVTHGEFGAYLMEAAEDIAGKQADGVRVISVSPRLSLSEVRKRVGQAIEELRHDGGLIIATDMPGGTPSNLVLPLVKDVPNTEVISGLNLYMLVSAFNQRKEAPLEEVARKMLADGQRSIQDMKAALKSRYPCR